MNALLLFLVPIQSDQKHKFNQMRTYYGTLISTVARLIEAKVPLENLKTHLQFCYRDLRPQLELAESYKKVMFIIEDKHTIIDIDCLQAIVEYFNIEEAKDHIAAYQLAIEEFCKYIRLTICFNESFKSANTSLLKCETVEFVLEWNGDEYSLNDFKVLLQKAFQGMANRIQVRYIKEGNSIIVTCYAPRHIMDVLLIEAEKNLDLLRGNGLIKLSISYHIVYDACTRDKVKDMSSTR